MKKVTVELTPFELSLLTALLGASNEFDRARRFNHIPFWSDKEHSSETTPRLYRRLKDLVDSIEPEVDESDIGKTVYIRDTDSQSWEARKLVAILPPNIKNRYVTISQSFSDRVCIWNQAKKKLD